MMEPNNMEIMGSQNAIAKVKALFCYCFFVPKQPRVGRVSQLCYIFFSAPIKKKIFIFGKTYINKCVH